MIQLTPQLTLQSKNGGYHNFKVPQDLDIKQNNQKEDKTKQQQEKHNCHRKKG